MAQADFNAVGRRKNAIARVRLVPGSGNILINKRELDNYFGLETLKMTVRQPWFLPRPPGLMYWSASTAAASPASPALSVMASAAR